LNELLFLSIDFISIAKLLNESHVSGHELLVRGCHGRVAMNANPRAVALAGDAERGDGGRRGNHEGKSSESTAGAYEPGTYRTFGIENEGSTDLALAHAALAGGAIHGSVPFLGVGHGSRFSTFASGDAEGGGRLFFKSFF
jgi:hypothetical protein